MDKKKNNVVEYVSGECNIGPQGRIRRVAFGVLGLAVTLVVWQALIFFGATRELRLLLFIPLYSSFISIWQAQQHFCVYLAKEHAYDLR